MNGAQRREFVHNHLLLSICHPCVFMSSNDCHFYDEGLHFMQHEERYNVTKEDSYVH